MSYTSRTIRENDLISQIVSDPITRKPDPVLYAKYLHDPAFHMVVVMAARAQASLEDLAASE